VVRRVVWAAALSFAAMALHPDPASAQGCTPSATLTCTTSTTRNTTFTAEITGTSASYLALPSVLASVQRLFAGRFSSATQIASVTSVTLNLAIGPGTILIGEDQTLGSPAPSNRIDLVVPAQAGTHAGALAIAPV